MSKTLEASFSQATSSAASLAMLREVSVSTKYLSSSRLLASEGYLQRWSALCISPSRVPCETNATIYG